VSTPQGSEEKRNKEARNVSTRDSKVEVRRGEVRVGRGFLMNAKSFKEKEKIEKRT